MRTRSPTRALTCGQALAFAVLALALLPTHSSAQRNDPYAYGLRIGLFPAAFRAGISQSAFGSALRAEVDIVRGFTLQAAGAVPFLPVAGEKDVRGYDLRAGILLNVIDRVEIESLEGTVHPADAPAAGGQQRGTDSDLDVPVSQKLGSPPFRTPERGTVVAASQRIVHSIRLGYDRVRAVEKLRPNTIDDNTRHAVNDLNVLYLGYAFANHWNLTGAAAGGERALGWRRFYVDALFTLPELYDVERLSDDDGSHADTLVVGARIGMEGAFDALLASPEELGFGYSLELGALPGDSGAEGYLLVGLGVELDFMTRR